MSNDSEMIRQPKITNAYQNTMKALQQAEEALPVFESSYDGEIKRLYEKIVGRQEFRYDPDSDPLYSSYRQRYVNEGRLAMRDTQGQTAALTGGYGSSYAQAVGQQQYEAYLAKLGEIMPELYSAAYDRYKAEGDRLKDQYYTAKGIAGIEFDRYTDERDRLAQSEQQSYERRWAAYQNLISLISNSGYEPEEAELEATGMSRAQAEALRQEYLRINGLLPSSSSSSHSSSWYGTVSTAEDDSKKKTQTKQSSKENVLLKSLTQTTSAAAKKSGK